MKDDDKVMVHVEYRTCPACHGTFDLNLIEEVLDGIETFTCPNCKAVLDVED